MADIQSWLESIGLGEYTSNFINEGFDLHLVKSAGLSDSDFKALSITKLGHKKKILLSISGSTNNSVGINCFSQELENCIDSSCCWEVLKACEESNNSNGIDKCWEYISKNTSEIVNSVQFPKISKKHLLQLLQLQTISIREIVLIESVDKWVKNNTDLMDDEMLSNIRFGVLSRNNLEIVEKLEWITKESLYFALRKIVFPDADFSALKIPSKYFTNRYSGKDIYANEIPYTPSCSTIYPGYTLSYASLVDDKYNFPGIATNYGDSWIKASYPENVIASQLTLSAPTKGEFLSGGWDSSYIKGVELQVLTNNKWKTILKTDKESKEGPVTYTFPRTSASEWRLYKNPSYLATGTFILHK